MKAFLAGAAGAVGRQLVPQLAAAGHEVVGTTRSENGCASIQRLGATPAVVDLLDADAVQRAVSEAKPDAIVHQATDLAGMGSDFRHFDRLFAMTKRLRTEGTEHLLAAATGPSCTFTMRRARPSQLLGAKAPRHVPAWIARLVAGEGATFLMTAAPPASNDRTRSELGWVPRFASWRDGFRAESQPAAPDSRNDATSAGE